MASVPLVASSGCSWPPAPIVGSCRRGAPSMTDRQALAPLSTRRPEHCPPDVNLRRHDGFGRGHPAAARPVRDGVVAGPWSVPEVRCSTTRTACVEVHRVVVGPMDNNVYVIRCTAHRRRRARRRGQRARAAARDVPRPRGPQGGRDPRPLGPHPGRPGRPRRRLRGVGDRPPTPGCCPPTTCSSRTTPSSRWAGCGCATIATPGHTPGSMCFAVEGTPLLLQRRHPLPGRARATPSFPGGDFPTIIRSIEDRLFSRFGPDTIVLPGHGRLHHHRHRGPHLQEWIDRGW